MEMMSEPPGVTPDAKARDEEAWLIICHLGRGTARAVPWMASINALALLMMKHDKAHQANYPLVN